MRVLVTGGSGFIGRAAVAQLIAAGAEVQLLGRGPAGPAGTLFHRLDLLDVADFEPLLRELRPTHLLHFAWETIPPSFWRSSANLDWVAASLRLVRAFAASGGRRLVVGGSCTEYRWAQEPLDERTTPLLPATPYGRAKASLFEILEAFVPELGVSLAWGRIFFPFGPGERRGRLLPDTISSLLDGNPVELTDGLQELDFIYVDDVAAAFAALLASEVEGPVNIASGTPRSVRSVVEAFADRSGGRELLGFGLRPRRPWEAPRVVGRVERLRDEVGFRPGVEWEEAVDRTLAYWRQAGSQLPQA